MKKRISEIKGITKEKQMEIDIKALYTKYDGNDETGGRDSWEVIADIINEVAPRTDFTTDATYFHQNCGICAKSILTLLTQKATSQCHR